jgi:hypothetical protein
LRPRPRLAIPLAGLAALSLLAAAAAAGGARADGPVLRNLVVVLQGLDKVTARTTVIRAVVGEAAQFGTLRVTPRACLETPPTEPPESAAFLEIAVADPGSEPKTAFTGWMFASSPSLSALEHPVYDVWVIDCAEPLEPELEAVPEPAEPSAPATPGPAPEDG